MRRFATHIRVLFACFVAALFIAAPVLAASDVLDKLYVELADPDNQEWQRAQSDILREWSRSGSPTMDLLLKRGREAMDAGDPQGALEHLTALTDHAPDFAEGWNARATAYFMLGEIGPSVADIGRTLELNAHHFGALDGLGMILEQLDRDEAAKAVYRASLAINPHQDTIRQSLERLDQKTTGTAL